MNHHFGILQHRIQPIAVGTRNQVKCARSIRHSQGLERACHEIADRQKKQLNAGQNHADVRHQLAIFVAVGQQNGNNVDCQQKAPEKQ